MSLDSIERAGAALNERSRRLNERPPRPQGAYVLYWMTTALRATENPAFERALLAAHKLRKPLVVYHGLSSRYAHASDRIHRFILDGEQQLAGAIQARGATFVHHLERGPAARRPLDLLLAEACLLVTDEFPTYDVRAWVESVARRAPCAMIAVDAACVAPMALISRAHDRAFAYRKEAQRLWTPRMAPVPALPPPPALATPLPFEGEAPPPPEALPALIAGLPIDHAVPPAPDRTGGERAAQQRWRRFVERGLRSYGARRNNALDDDGVSGLSPYLHFGMIWAGQIAREASAVGGDGAEKYIDELLVWRELAWSWAFHTPRHHTLDAVPSWAVSELRARQRSLLEPTLRELDLGETGDALWDAAQRRLRRDGWLHNNVRMTWGKQIVAWIRDPGRALAIAEELNHRYALDGRDPSSYGGILWCLGLFDRPHDHTREMGRVRPRPTAEHARRLPPSSYAPPALDPRQKGRTALIIGAGLAGLSCAQVLEGAGVQATVLEKSVAPGGRLVHRQRGGHLIDDGAPRVHARRPSFRRLLDHHRDLLAPAGAPLDAQGPCWALPQGSRSLTGALARGLAVRTGALARSLRLLERGVEVTLDDGATLQADHVILTAPAPQSHALLAALGPCPALDALASVSYTRALVASFEVKEIASTLPPLDARLALLFDERARGRGPQVVTVHSTHETAERLAQASDDEAQAEVARAAAASLGLSEAPPCLHFKRWRHARPERPLGQQVLSSHGHRVLVAGDGVADGSAEGAWESGAAAASLLLGLAP